MHLAPIAEHLNDKLALTDVCDLSEEALKKAVERFPGVRATTDYADMLENGCCDAVLIATPLPLHARHAVQALEAGKHVLSEVTAAASVEECWQLVEAVERSGMIYMLAENYTYMRTNMMIKNMVAEGVFGELTYAEGAYIHDCRSLMSADAGVTLTWRGERPAKQFGVLSYPTHSLGPVAQWFAEAGDSLKSIAAFVTQNIARPDYDARNYKVHHTYLHSDSATGMIQTANGGLINIRVDTASPRPHNMNHYALQGRYASFLGQRHHAEPDLIWIDGRSPTADDGTALEWEELAAYAKEYEHPYWREWGNDAREAGHGGGDYFVLRDFADSIIKAEAPPIDVYDAAAWSVTYPLSIESTENGGATLPIPDFRAGRS
jgi:predicted dehydrogenase